MDLYDSHGNRATKVRTHIRRLNGSGIRKSDRQLSGFIFTLLLISTVIWILSKIWIFAIILFGIILIITILLRVERIKRKFREFKISFSNWRR